MSLSALARARDTPPKLFRELVLCATVVRSLFCPRLRGAFCVMGRLLRLSGQALERELRGCDFLGPRISTDTMEPLPRGVIQIGASLPRSRQGVVDPVTGANVHDGIPPRAPYTGTPQLPRGSHAESSEGEVGSVQSRLLPAASESSDQPSRGRGRGSGHGRGRGRGRVGAGAEPRPAKSTFEAVGEP